MSHLQASGSPVSIVARRRELRQQQRRATSGNGRPLNHRRRVERSASVDVRALRDSIARFSGYFIAKSRLCAAIFAAIVPPHPGCGAACLALQLGLAHPLFNTQRRIHAARTLIHLLGLP